MRTGSTHNLSTNNPNSTASSSKNAPQAHKHKGQRDNTHHHKNHHNSKQHHHQQQQQPESLDGNQYANQNKSNTSSSNVDLQSSTSTVTNASTASS